MKPQVCSISILFHSINSIYQGLLEFTMDIQTGDKISKNLIFEKIMSNSQIGEIHTLLMTFHFKLQQIKSMLIEWKRFNRPQDKERINKGKQMKIQFIQINYMSHLDRRFVNNV